MFSLKFSKQISGSVVKRGRTEWSRPQIGKTGTGISLVIRLGFPEGHTTLTVSESPSYVKRLRYPLQ